MNKTYIKRQILLNELEIPISKDIQNYIRCFDNIIGYPEYLVKIYGKGSHKYDGHLYLRDDKKLFFHNENNKEAWIHYDIWRKFKNKLNLNYGETKILFKILLENKFNFTVSGVWRTMGNTGLDLIKTYE